MMKAPVKNRLYGAPACPTPEAPTPGLHLSDVGDGRAGANGRLRGTEAIFGPRKWVYPEHF